MAPLARDRASARLPWDADRAGILLPFEVGAKRRRDARELFTHLGNDDNVLGRHWA
jgi:hypothetical protein